LDLDAPLGAAKLEILPSILIMLAIVIFCQPFTQGQGANALASASSNQLREEFLEPAIRDAFPNEGEWARFQTLRETLIQRRNSVLGHAAATPFSIDHGIGVTSMKMFATAATGGIDFPFWASALRLIQGTLLQRLPE
jgi:hypothetical protein